MANYSSVNFLIISIILILSPSVFSGNVQVHKCKRTFPIETLLDDHRSSLPPLGHTVKPYLLPVFLYLKDCDNQTPCKLQNGIAYSVTGEWKIQKNTKTATMRLTTLVNGTAVGDYVTQTPDEADVCQHMFPQCPLYDLHFGRFVVWMTPNFPTVPTYADLKIEILDDKQRQSMCAIINLTAVEPVPEK